jgi:hypothetical protein
MDFSTGTETLGTDQRIFEIAVCDSRNQSPCFSPGFHSLATASVLRIRITYVLISANKYKYGLSKAPFFW